ncbi:MAG: 2-phospho-L-lactate transferase CofD family protein [Steroidobacteraceae bacterium]
MIFTGGTGSIALQRGLYHALDENLDGFDTKIIVNAYDNGLSTGAVRRVMDGRILGPSDIRKNQSTRLQLRDPNSPWVTFLKGRFTVDSSIAREFCEAETLQLMETLEKQGSQVDCRSTFFSALEMYFQSPLAARIDYEDFSLANIIYAGLARIHDNSLRAAAGIMAGVMGIPDTVLLNDDRSLFLGASTQDGRRIIDEGDIVSWGNEADPFVDIFFTDADGNEDKPTLCLEAWRAILEADLIILSSGTQWSSLIPTYASDGFKSAINSSDATILMVMNRSPDKDSPSQTSSELIDILVPRYFDAGRLHVLADENAHPRMRSLDNSALSKIASFTQADMSLSVDPADKHDPSKLATAVGHVLFKDYLESDFYLFDYDDTLVGRGGRCPKSSRVNVKGLCRLNSLANVGICTGNTITAIDLRSEPAAVSEALQANSKSLLVFADGAVNEYLCDTVLTADDAQPVWVKCIWPDTLLPTQGPYTATKIGETLRRAGLPLVKVENRGGALIAIKPVDQDYRHALLCLVRHIIHGSDLEVRETGRTTVEICKPALSKIGALRYLRTNSAALPQITYVGDEFETGNDRDIEELAISETGVKCLHVDSPAQTAFFISTLTAYRVKNGKR